MSKVVKMLTKITGTRNAVEWPDAGETIELPDAEAEGLVASKLAKFAKKDSNTYQSADHVDHSGDVVAANEAIREHAAAKPVETADDDDADDAESTALTTAKAGRR